MSGGAVVEVAVGMALMEASVVVVPGMQKNYSQVLLLNIFTMSARGGREVLVLITEQLGGLQLLVPAPQRRLRMGVLGVRPQEVM